MRHFDADDQVWMFASHPCRSSPVHVLRVLLDLTAPHPMTDDVEHREHSHHWVIDVPVEDATLELRKTSPAGTSGVHYRGDPAAQTHSIGCNAKVSTCKRAPLSTA